MKSRILDHKPELERIIEKCQICHIAMVDLEGKPYVLPFNFGYDADVFYLHSGPTGKKNDILRQNNEVCLALSSDYVLKKQNEKVACSYGWKYRSVLAYGKVEFIENPEEKIKALNILMKNYTDKEFEYSGPSVKDVCVFKLVVDRMEGRAYGY